MDYEKDNICIDVSIGSSIAHLNWPHGLPFWTITGRSAMENGQKNIHVQFGHIHIYPFQSNFNFDLFFCQPNISVRAGKKPRSEKPNRTRSEKVVPNSNQNWLNIRMGLKFWYLKNRNQIRSESKYFGYPNISEIDL